MLSEIDDFPICTFLISSVELYQSKKKINANFIKTVMVHFGDLHKWKFHCDEFDRSSVKLNDFQKWNFTETYINDVCHSYDPCREIVPRFSCKFYLSRELSCFCYYQLAVFLIRHIFLLFVSKYWIIVWSKFLLLDSLFVRSASFQFNIFFISG